MTSRRLLAPVDRVAGHGALAGALAHELSQPLAALLADARTAQLLLGRPTPDVTELARIVDDIVAGVTRARAIVDRIRAMIRRDEPSLAIVALNDVVADVLRLTNGELTRHEVAVRTRTARPSPFVYVEPIQLQQVLVNLILNACDAMGECGRSERRITITTQQFRGAAYLSVADRGTGIPTRPIDGIFDPFVTTKAHGLGLGLTISRALVRANGGRLWAVNNVRRGATLHLSLPLWTTPVPSRGQP